MMTTTARRPGGGRAATTATRRRGARRAVGRTDERALELGRNLVDEATGTSYDLGDESDSAAPVEAHLALARGMNKRTAVAAAAPAIEFAAVYVGDGANRATLARFGLAEVTTPTAPGQTRECRLVSDLWIAVASGVCLWIVLRSCATRRAVLTPVRGRGLVRATHALLPQLSPALLWRTPPIAL